MSQAPGELEIRQLTDPAEHRAAEALFADLWRSGPAAPPVSADLMRALAFVDAYVAGVFLGGTGTDALVGASVGFLGRHPGGSGAPYLHSHITGVAPSARGRRVGYALKQDQREWALRRGITSINWTFDPLVRRNAYFNLTLLGARPTRYLVDFYGEMADSVNAGQGSDRLLVEWRLDTDQTPAEPAVGPLVEAGRVLLDVAADGGPVRSEIDADGPVLCRVPEDIVTLRGTDPALARAWRAALRDTLGTALAAGHRVRGITRSGWYLMEQQP